MTLRSIPRVLLACLAIALACRLGSAGAAGSEPPAELLEHGARVFAERCSPCHGPTGHGDGQLAEALAIRPRNYHRDAFKWGTRPDEIATTVRLGRSGVMPAFEGALTEQEIRAVAYLVWSWLPAERRQPEPQRTSGREPGER
jgi:cytochrome c oxidase cbb3-type subunit 3